MDSSVIVIDSDDEDIPAKVSFRCNFRNWRLFALFTFVVKFTLLYFRRTRQLLLSQLLKELLRVKSTAMENL